MARVDRPRYWEADLLRGLCVISMVVYHVIFDLLWFGDLEVSLNAPGMRAARLIIAPGFILMVGASLSLSRHRLRGKRGFSGHLVRGGGIFLLGILATLGSLLIVPDAPIYFGALHCIGVCIVLAYPFRGLRFVKLVLGLVLTAAGISLAYLEFGFPWLLWLGLRPEGLRTVDLFPLLPWFGVVLLGMFAADLLYKPDGRVFKLPDLSRLPPIRALGFLGRHTLVIYIVHQPLVLGLLFLLGLIELNP